MATERYNKAARDGYLDALKEATRKDLNSRDEDGMTPTLWAAFEGNLDALRLIVGRGGDPDKCDNYGNSALHFASARGHLNCVSFLVNFGVNMWALDIDFHTPKDLAAINNKDDILRYLDSALSKEEAKDKKKVKALKEKAEKDAQKRAKDFDKLQKKASKSVEEEQKKLAKQREKMEKGGTVSGDGSQNQAPRPAMAFLSLRKDTKPIQGQSTKFSEIVASSDGGSGGGTAKPAYFTGVYKKVQQRKTLGGTKGPKSLGSEFKVAALEGDGKRSVRSLSGLRRDNEVMYVPKYDIPSRGKITDLFDEAEEDNNTNTNGNSTVRSMSSSRTGNGVMTRSLSQPDYLNSDGGGTEAGFNDDQGLPHNSVSIFDRPGFGSVAFRHTVSSTMSNFADFQNGRAGGAGRPISKSGPWEDLEAPSEEDEEEDQDQDESGPLEVFLVAAGLPDYIRTFVQEKIDLDALMLLTEEDLTTLGIPMGPRRKLLKSIKERTDALESPGEVFDSRL